MFEWQEKLCQTIFLPTALPVGVSRLMPSSGGISPLTCTIFDPIYFGTILRNQISHISPTSLKKFIMGNYLTTSTSLLKSHTGATQALTRARESWLACLKIIFVHYYCFSLFLVYGIKPILPIFNGFK